MTLELLRRLRANKKIHPPSFLINNMIMLGRVGSVAYGASLKSSDTDLVGICFPQKEMVFPHLAGEIFGFGEQIKRFESWQQHHVKDLGSEKEYDFTIYGIVKFFQLAMDCNPNIIDLLYLPRDCVTHSTIVWEMIRENRDLFLSKKAWHRFKGYAYSQLNKLRTKDPNVNSPRRILVEKYGYDVKFAYHVVRLMDYIEQILTTKTVDMRRSAEVFKAIRRGEWTFDQLVEWQAKKEKYLESLYHTSNLAHTPREPEIKQLLIKCLEHHYGDLSTTIHQQNSAERKLEEIKRILG